MSIIINGLGSGIVADKRLDRERRRRQRSSLMSLELVQSEDSVVSLSGASYEERSRGRMVELRRALENAEEATAIISQAQSGAEAILESAETLVARLAETLEDKNRPEWELPRKDDRGFTPPWLGELIQRMEGAAMQCHFGDLRLLDGSLGVSGASAGDGLSFVSATEKTRSSPPNGYEVRLTREPVRATVLGEKPLNEQVLRPGLTLAIIEDGRTASYACVQGDTPTKVVKALARECRRKQLEVTIGRTTDGRILVQHRRFGSRYKFLVESSEPGLLSTAEGGSHLVSNGRDIIGRLNGEPAHGEGQTLTGLEENPTTSGLCVRYTGLPYTGYTARLPRKQKLGMETDLFVGRIIVAQQALSFPLGENAGKHFKLRLDSLRPKDLGKGVETASGFVSLANISVHTPYQAKDALKVARAARDEVIDTLTRLRLLSEGKLATAMNGLKVQSQNYAAARNAGISNQMKESVNTLSRRIQMEGRVALSAQHSPSQRSVIGLLEEEERAGKAPVPVRLN